MPKTTQQQVTDLYTRLTALNSQVSNLALESRIASLQSTLTTSIETINTDLTTSQAQIKEVQLDMADAIALLRTK